MASSCLACASKQWPAGPLPLAASPAGWAGRAWQLQPGAQAHAQCGLAAHSAGLQLHFVLLVRASACRLPLARSFSLWRTGGGWLLMCLWLGCAGWRSRDGSGCELTDQQPLLCVAASEQAAAIAGPRPPHSRCAWAGWRQAEAAQLCRLGRRCSDLGPRRCTAALPLLLCRCRARLSLPPPAPPCTWGPWPVVADSPWPQQLRARSGATRCRCRRLAVDHARVLPAQRPMHTAPSSPAASSSSCPHHRSPPRPRVRAAEPRSPRRPRCMQDAS